MRVLQTDDLTGTHPVCAVRGVKIHRHHTPSITETLVRGVAVVARAGERTS